MRLRLLGSCDGCPSSSVTLKLAVEGAIEAAAPEITGHQGGGGTRPVGRRALIPVTRVRPARRGRSGNPSDGGRRGNRWRSSTIWLRCRTDVGVGSTAVLACRIGDRPVRLPSTVCALRGVHAGRCTGATSGRRVRRRGAALPSLSRHYDVRRAGAGLDERRAAPNPLPLLARHRGLGRSPRPGLGMSGSGRRRRPVVGAAADHLHAPAAAVGERCEMCAEPIADEHPHVVNLREPGADVQLPRLLPAVHRGARASCVTGRCPTGTSPSLVRPREGGAWDDLQIPVGLAFLFRNSVQGRMVAFYPGPAGATESELPLDAWDASSSGNPDLGHLRPDVEALLLRRSDREHAGSVLSRPHRRLLRAGRAPAIAVAWLRRRPGGARARWTTSSRGRGAQQAGARLSGPRCAREQLRLLGPRHLRRAVRRRATARWHGCGSARPPARRSTPSRCGARSGSNRSAALRRGRARRACVPCSASATAGWTPSSPSCGCSAAPWSRGSPAPPRWTLPCPAPTTST